jgi:hypothetical protein
MREACDVVTSRHHYWQQVPGMAMYRPIFVPVDAEIPERVNTFRGHGTFLALHCFVLQHGPFPISIWLIFALIMGRKAMLIPQNILRYMDPAAYDILEPWYDFHQETPVPPPTEPTHPLRQFILNYIPDMQVRAGLNFFPHMPVN